MTFKPTRIFLHCSATENGRPVLMEEIRRWHVEQNGWKDVGYHGTILPSGIFERGRPLTEPGAHAKGHNHDSLAFCLIGTDRFTWEQMKAMRSLVRATCANFRIPEWRVYGHHEFNPGKTCPGIPMADFMRFLMSGDRAAIAPYLLETVPEWH